MFNRPFLDMIWFYSIFIFEVTFTGGLKSKGNSTSNMNAWFWTLKPMVIPNRHIWVGLISQILLVVHCVSQVFELWKILPDKKHVMQNLLKCGACCVFLPRQSFCFVARWYGSFSTLVSMQMIRVFLGRSRWVVKFQFGRYIIMVGLNEINMIFNFGRET